MNTLSTVVQSKNTVQVTVGQGVNAVATQAWNSTETVRTIETDVWIESEEQHGEIMTKRSETEKSGSTPCRSSMFVVYYGSTILLIIIYTFYGKKIDTEFKNVNLFADMKADLRNSVTDGIVSSNSVTDSTVINYVISNKDDRNLLKEKFRGIKNLWGTLPIYKGFGTIPSHHYGLEINSVLFNVFLVSFILSSVALLITEIVIPLNLYFRSQLFSPYRNTENFDRMCIVGATGTILVSELFYMFLVWKYMEGYATEKGNSQQSQIGNFLSTPKSNHHRVVSSNSFLGVTRQSNDGCLNCNPSSNHVSETSKSVLVEVKYGQHSYDNWWYVLLLQLFISSLSSIIAAWFTSKMKHIDYSPNETWENLRNEHAQPGGVDVNKAIENNAPGSNEKVYAGMEKWSVVYGGVDAQGKGFGKNFNWCYTSYAIKLAQGAAIYFAFHVTVFDLFIYPFFFNFH